MEKSNGIERSEVWEQIHKLVKQIPREKCEGDAPDAPSVTTSIEELFLKLLPIHNVSVSDFSDFELQRLFDWLQDPKREPAQTKFTAGMTRNVAREFEYLLKHSR